MDKPIKGARGLAQHVLAGPGELDNTKLLARALLSLCDRLEALEGSHAFAMNALEVEERLGMRA